MEYKHYPVLYKELIEALNIKPGGTYCDCTFGGGGHSSLVLEKLGPTGRLFAIDRDEDAGKNAEKLDDSRLTFLKGNFSDVKSLLASRGAGMVDGIIADLGVSSYQIDNAERGFSYSKNAPLDMRMDRSQPLDAAGVVNSYDEKRLADIIYMFGEERYSRRIAAAIVRERKEAPITTTLQLKTIIEAAVPAEYRYSGGSAAKRTFQAIRIEVNSELDILPSFIYDAAGLLTQGGRLAVITFHSLEDRIVKTCIADLEKSCTCPPDFPICICGGKQVLKKVNKKVITPGEEELGENTRSHSAKLRVAEKI